jgi:hypothetical protein
VLRSFRVANHLSLRAEQELLLLPAYDKTRPALPVAGIYGANAAGKSNLLDALRFMQSAVRDSYIGWDPRLGVPRTPFRLDDEAGHEPSAYVVELLLHGVRHIYGFEVDDKRVREEWLYAFPHNRRQVIFDREGKQIRTGPTAGPARGKVATLQGLLPETALFLTLAGRTQVSEVAEAYEWFTDRLSFICEDDLRPDEEQLATDLDDARAAKRVMSLIRAADMGVERVTTVTTSAGQRRLRFQHNRASGGQLLTLEDEAHGTRVWLSYATKVLHALDSGGVLVIDEVDRSLHPRLTSYLVGLFREPHTNRNGAQLIFTTHESSLLMPFMGDEALGRDEVWFVEKDRNGQTSLFALSDFKPRKQEQTQRRYLGGSYGAVPQLFVTEFENAVLPYDDGAEEHAAK